MFVIPLCLCSGLEDSQKDLFLGLLNGNSDALTSQIHSLLGSPDQVEAARQQFLESPDLAEAMGLPMDILADPAQFAALMAEGIEELSKLDGSSSGDDDGDNDGDDGVDGRESIRSLLGGSSRRARLGDSDEEEDEEVGEFDVDVSGEALRANQAQLDRLRKKLLGSMQRAA